MSRMITEQPLIKVTELKKSFGNKTILDGLNLHLAHSENLIVLGRSGVGKSVLIKCLVRLIEPDAGEVHILGYNTAQIEDDNEMNEFRRKVGFLFQGGALYDSMTVEENLRFPLERSGKDISRGEAEDLITEVLEGVGLPDTRTKWPSELSGGMQKRIALARSLMLRPQIMLYDEPTTGLDPMTSYEISSLIMKMKEKYDMASIIITHDLPCARITADRIVVLRDGGFVEEGTYESLQHSGDEWVKSFFEKG